MSLLLAALCSFTIGVTLGLLGGGVSTLTLPMLVYVVGVAPEQAAAASLFVVCVTSVTGAFAHARAGRVAFRAGAVFAIGGVIGAYGGALLGHALSPRALLSAFGLEMLAAALAMMRARKNEDPRRARPGAPSVPGSVTLGAAVGAISGLAGVGGGFLVVPALEAAGGLGLREAIGTSPFVMAVQSLAAIAGRMGHVEIDWRLIGLLALSTMVGCVGGASLGQRLSTTTLRRGFAWLVLGVALFVLARQALGGPPHEASSRRDAEGHATSSLGVRDAPNMAEIESPSEAVPHHGC